MCIYGKWLIKEVETGEQMGQVMKTGGQVRGPLGHGWEIVMERSWEWEIWLERRDRRTDYDTQHQWSWGHANEKVMIH